MRWGRATAIGFATTLLGAGAARGVAAEERKPRHVVRFDGDTIDGDRTRPDGELSAVRAPVEPPSLVEAPKSFERASRRTILSAAAEAGGVARK
jgi:hypothetical protein